MPVWRPEGGGRKRDRAKPAHQVLRIQDVQDSSAGTTLNVGVIQGGTTPNVVPASASAEIDVRVASLAEAERITQALQSLRAVTPDVQLEVSGGFNRPPMERSPAIASLFDQARRIGRELGLELNEGSTGGGSDGNFTAALGVPTLDGLGVRGGGAHADDEQHPGSTRWLRSFARPPGHALLLESQVESA